jgi:putative ABC transport system permease protein
VTAENTLGEQLGQPVQRDSQVEAGLAPVPAPAPTPPKPHPIGQVRSLKLLATLARQMVWAEWRAHPWRQLAAVLAVALGVALGLSVHLINEAALTEFGAAARSANGQPDASLRCAPACADTLFDLLATQPGVASAHPMVAHSTQAVAASGQRVALSMLGVDGLSVAAVAPDLMPRAATGQPRLALLMPGNVFLNATAQTQLGLAVGDELRVQQGTAWVTWRVAGQVAAGGAALAVVDIAAAQQRLGWPGQLQRVDLRLQPGIRLADVQATLAPLLAQAHPAAQWHSAQDDEQALSALSRAYRVNLTVLALVALFVGTFLVFSVMALSVAQRMPQLALLGVLGLSAQERRRLVLAESLATGLGGAALGTALGVALSWAALRWLAGDLGGGYFAGVSPSLSLSWPPLFAFAMLGVAAAAVGGWMPALRAQSLAPAQALKGMGGGSHARHWPRLTAPALLALGAVLALLPPWQGLPLGAYASVGCLLLGGMAGVPWAVQAVVASGQRGFDRVVARGQARWVPAWLALHRASHDRQEATVAVAGVVASLSLAVALTVMVSSFRDSVTQWLDQVLPADLYVRSATRSTTADGAYLDATLVARAASLPGVVRVEPHRLRSLALAPGRPNVTLVARPLAEPLRQLPLVAGMPVWTPQTESPSRPAESPGSIGSPGSIDMAAPLRVWVTEAMVAIHGAHPGTRLMLPLGPNARTEVVVAGVWRDYARQFGAIAIDLADYQRLSGDLRVNDLALWLAPGASADAVMTSLRSAATDSTAQLANAPAVSRLSTQGDAARSPAAPNAPASGTPDNRATSGLLEFAQPGQIRAQSLRIFDRSFAVTHYLQALAMGIGLFGIAASFSAQVLARRREFGLLSHLGFTRQQVVATVAGEGVAWTAAGALLGLALGLAVAVVLVHVVNPQSFHWTMSLSLPWERLGLLCAVVVLAGGLTTAWAARRAASVQAVRAVKEDW